MRTPETPRREGRVALKGNLAPFRNRNYSLFWIGFASTHTGRWIEQTGAVWLVYELTKSPIALGFLGIARALPVILLSPVGGVIADRLNQRKLLFTTQGLGFLVSLALGLLILTGRVEPWHIYVEVAIQATITAFDASVRQALFPRLVDRSILPEAVTLAVTAGRSAKFIGPTIGGLAIAFWGEASPFLLNALTFLALMAAVSSMRGVPPREPGNQTTFRGEMIDGLRLIRRVPILNGLMRLELVFGIFQLNPVIITIVAREVFNLGPEGLGSMISAPALGSLFGIGALLAFRQPQRQGRFVLLCTGAYAIGLVGFALAGSYLVALVALVILGALDALVSITRQSVVQMAAPARMRGRVVANIATVTRGTPALAEAQSGFSGGLLGPAFALVGAAALVGLGGLAVLWSTPAVWRYARTSAVDDELDVGQSIEPAGS